MPLLEEVKLAAEGYVEQAEQKLVEAARPPAPLEPLLEGRQELARLSPQPDRRVAVLAAPSPLVEAARPPLDALANMPQTPLDAEQITALHAELTREIASFQSVCREARMPREEITSASYALCAALDEAACMTCWGGAVGKEAGEWAARLLAVQFHGDAQGGVKLFKLLGLVFARARSHIDLLDLLHRILEAGFMGSYRSTLKGPRVLEDIRRNVEDKIMTERRQQAEEAKWERANPAPTIVEVPYPYAPYVEKRDWVHSVLLEVVLPALVAVVIGSVWWFFF
jgi:type IV/VI secretion system ImpK/VasF family protein